jgi:hypothetical protein
VQEEEDGGRVSQKAKWAGWLLGQLGQKPRVIPFSGKVGFFNLQRLWKIYTRRFRRDFDVGIFPQFLWAPQGF